VHIPCGSFKKKLLFHYTASAVLGAFAELRKATISFVKPGRPPARMKQLGSYWADFHEI
jgi:hypothetical protein